MSASPSPISEWKLTISANIFEKSISPGGHDNRNSKQNNAAAAITLVHAATIAPMTTPFGLLPTKRCTSRRTACPPQAPITAMCSTLAPSANKPPSENIAHCTNSTSVIATQPAHGPTTVAASTPPSRCPLTGAPIGKLTI